MNFFVMLVGLRRSLLVVLGISLCSAHAFADEAQIQQELANLKARILILEEQLNAQQKTGAVQPDNETAGKWTDRVGFSGLVEVEAAAVDGPDGSESDLVLATVELGIDVQVNEWISAHLLLLFEEDDTEPLEVDEAIISIANPERSPFYLNVGRMVLPFGSFASHMVSDPLTLELGESHESALEFGVAAGGLQASLFLFNGDANENGDNRVDQYGASLGFSHQSEGGNFNIETGLSYINNIADSDNLQDGVFDAEQLTDQVSGASGYLILNAGSFSLIGEYLSATERFESADLAFRGRGAEPVSWNLEAAYHFTLGEWGSSFALAWQGTDEALVLELPEQRIMAALSMEIMANTSLSLEWASDEDYDIADGGSGEDSDTFTAQLAVEF